MSVYTVLKYSCDFQRYYSNPMRIDPIKNIQIFKKNDTQVYLNTPASAKLALSERKKHYHSILTKPVCCYTVLTWMYDIYSGSPVYNTLGRMAHLYFSIGLFVLTSHF